MINVIEKYLPLIVSEQAELDDLLNQGNESEVRAMVIIHEIRGQHKMLLRLLRQKYGDLPQEVARIQSMESEDELERLSIRLLDARSPAELGLLEDDNE